MTNNDSIENIFKEQLETFEQEPSNEVWKNIKRKMFLKRFLKYNPFSLNLWNIIIISAILSSVFIITSRINDGKETKETNTINQTKQYKPKQNNTETNTSAKKIKIQNKKTVKNRHEKKQTQNKHKNNTVGLNEDVKVIETDNSKKNNTFSKSNNEETKQNVKLADKPHCEFTTDRESACEPAAISFINLSENGDSYLWNFGNGKTSNKKNPTFVFDRAGEYNVTLTIISGNITDSYSKKITIYPKPKASFEISGATKKYYTEEEINFVNNGSLYSKCKWDFGDGNTSSFINPSHIYENEGTYKVSLICTSKFNCSDTAFINNLYIHNSKYKIRFPTAFTPEKSGQTGGYWKNNPFPNTVFHPVTDENLAEYRLVIYNKYGVLVFESNNIDIGWNGFYNDTPAPSDVYVWECSGKFEDGKTFKETGNVTLLYLKNR